MIDIKLAQWATPAEIELINVINAKGSFRKAAKHLGVHHTKLTRMMTRLEVNAAVQGYAPANDMSHEVPNPFYVSQHSRNYVDGELKQEWIQSKPDPEKQWNAIIETITARCEAIPPRAPTPMAFKVPPRADLLNLITITDAHVGAMAWHREGGDDWDLAIARETLIRVFCGMIRALPPAKKIIINNLGDFLHTDGLKAVTPGHGHVLDADTRFPKLSEVGVEILEVIIACALENHEQVHFINAEGNHDESSSSWLRIMFKRIYRDEPRVTVEDSPLPYYAYEHGQVMLAFHHGHKLTPKDLPLWFAAKFSEMWGRTLRRYGHSGHYHHLMEKDFTGMRWLQHPTMAANDAHGSRSGYISPREAIAITYDLKKEINRSFATPDMFEESA